MSAAYTATRVRGMASWRPQARTQVLLDQIATVLSDYADHLPLTGRQVFYRLVATMDYPKTENAYKNLLEVLNRARRAGLVAFDDIRDDGVTVIEPDGFDDMSDFWRVVSAWATSYRRDRQAGQSVACEVWVEAAGMVPQVARAVERFGVPVYSSGGFDSTTAKYSAARRVIRRVVPTVVLHLGDLDPSGVAVFDSAADDVATMVADLGSPGAVQFERVAVTTEQAVAYDLPAAPAKVTDRRGNWTGGTVQAEAFDPATLAAIVEAAVEDVVDPTILARVEQIEAVERAELVAAIEAVSAGWR